MDLKTVLVTTLAVVSCTQLLSAQTNPARDCIATTQIFNNSAGVVTLQPQVLSTLSTTAFPSTARLLSSRIVGVGTAPVSQFSSFSTFGATSIPVGSPIISNSAGLFQSSPTLGLASTIGVPTTFSASPTLTFSAPQTLVSNPFAVASPGVAQILTNRAATEACNAATVGVQKTTASGCSCDSLQTFSSRLDALEATLVKLENSLSGPSEGGGRSNGGSSGEKVIDKLFEDRPADKADPPNDAIGDLLEGIAD